MASHAEITLTWADGDHVFNIAKHGQLLELEEKCNAGVYEIFNRLRLKTCYFSDVRETIRLGLIGGGLEPGAALKLTQRYVDARPFEESRHVAVAILIAMLVGVPSDPLGKPQTERAASETETVLSVPKSTESEQPSDSAPDKSTT